MVSKTLASLDAWLALAEEVLAEQGKLLEENRNGNPPPTPEQLSLFGAEAA
jgi:hypothetical protein